MSDKLEQLKKDALYYSKRANELFEENQIAEATEMAYQYEKLQPQIRTLSKKIMYQR